MSFLRITCIEEMTLNQSYMLMSQSNNHMYPSVQSYFSTVVTCPGHSWLNHLLSRWMIHESCSWIVSMPKYLHMALKATCTIAFIIIYNDVYSLHYCYVQWGSSGSTTTWTHCIVTVWELHCNSHNLLSTTVTVSCCDPIEVDFSMILWCEIRTLHFFEVPFRLFT